jgi:uncharacterized protein YhaN
MRLERLTLAPYGGFADRTLTFAPDAPLHVVLGRNEAGKTTALSAIGDWLYGFPLRTDQAWRFDMGALRIGGTFRLANGALFEARRRKGRGNTLVDAEDKPVSDAPLAAALGAVDRHTFQTEFGLTAEALRLGGAALLEAGGKLAETLAAGSANLSALVRLRDRLGEEAGELFTPRRSGTKAFYVALDAYDVADKKLREAVVTADALKGANQKKLDAANLEQRLREDYDDAGRGLAKRERASRTHLTLARLAGLAREAEAFADLPEIDAASLKAARAALDEDRAVLAGLARLTAEAQEESAEIAALVIDRALIDEGATIDVLREKLGAARKAADDLPRRVEARAQAVSLLDDLARRLGLPSHEELLAAPPSDAELALARHAIDARREATRRWEDARGRARDAALKRDQLDGLGEGPPVADPEPLRRRLDSLAERVADAERLRRERATLTDQVRALAEEAARLNPAVADLDALARAVLPSAVELAASVDSDRERAKARQVNEKELENAMRAVTAAEAALAAQEREAKGATRADWLAARELRDRGLDRLGDALEGKADRRCEALEDARALTVAADAIGEAVISDTERAARLQTAREHLAGWREALAHAEAEARRLADERQAAEAAWRALWARSDVQPGSPATMARWADRIEALLKRRDELFARRADAAALETGIGAAEASLRAWYEGLGLTPPPGFEFAYREARAVLAARQSAFEAARKAAEARVHAARAAKDAEADAARRESELAEIGAGWPQAMRGLRLAAEASPHEAEAALAAWAAAPLPRQNMARETRSIEGIERDLAEFDEGVAEIVARVAPDLEGFGAEAALARLVERLAEMRREAAKRTQLEKSAQGREAKRRAEEARRLALAPILAAAREKFGAPDDGALALALERCEARRANELQRAGLVLQLAQAGDGLSEAELRAEQQGLDPALLADEIAQLKARRDELDAARREAARAARDAEAELEALARGRDAARAARERAEAGGSLLDIAERWVLRQGAAKLAARAIERHRAAMQDPLVARAGEFFRIATGRSFEGLATDYDEADRPVLAAARAGGERVRIEGLSEGARDQLFLALRLALLERRAGEPLPFIGDDILASFDDDRTRLTLSLLADFGRKSQVILFTHHNHVADLARAAGADVIEL